MRSSHNAKSKRQFIKFRNYIRDSIKYTLIDFSRSKDPELQEIAKHMHVQILKWSPRTKEALVCVYDPTVIDKLSFKTLGCGHSDVADVKWISFFTRGPWEFFDLVNKYVNNCRRKLFNKQY